LGAVLDGIPESFILGLSVAAGAGVSVPFLIAVAVSNLPEGITSTASLKSDPTFSSRKLVALWSIVVVVSATVAGVGGWMGNSLPVEVTVLAQSFAAGALLTMLTDDLIPDADQDVGSVAGLAVATGFAVAFGLYQLGG
jgi:ZIP family zinc transporter